MDADALFLRVLDSPLHDRLEWVQRRWRPAVAIAETSEPTRIGSSRFGGAPDLPQDAAWPHHEKGPYRFLAQLDLSELSKHGAPATELFVSDGLLSLFVADDPTGEIDPECDLCWWGDPRYAIVMVSTPNVSLAPRTPPVEVDFGKAAAISFAATVDIPFDRYQVPDWPFSDEEEEGAYALLRAGLHGTNYLFGYPSHCTLAYDPTPTGYVPLLTVTSSDERSWCWHDGDCLMFFVEPSQPRIGMFPLRSDAG